VLGVFKPRRQVLGSELAGVVEQVGEAVQRFAVGDRVYASTAIGHGGGAHAEYISMPEHHLVEHMPVNLDFEQAAVIPFGGRAALHFLREAGVGPGQRVLINGASGCLGTYAVQLARHFGAQVTGVCSGKNADLVGSLGAEEVIDYTQEDFSERVGQFDIVFDAVGLATPRGCLRALAPGGAYANSVSSLDVSLRTWWWARGTGKRTLGGVTGDNPEYLSELKALAEAGAVKPVISRRFTLDEIRDAHRLVDSGHKVGNVVVVV
jgi:NADPH:quinone reductase-like Zn-dependent oxidoreductase